jgi:RecA-family ATPase
MSGEYAEYPVLAEIISMPSPVNIIYRYAVKEAMHNLTLDNIPLALTNDKLEQLINNPLEDRKPYAEGLLYEKTMLMVAAEPGCGKSTIALQAAIELASGLPVFGYFQVPRPLKVLYIQWERSIIEVVERLQQLIKTYKLPKENLAVTDEYQKLNIFRDYDLLIKCINRDCPKVDLIIIDPIYSTMIGGLKDDRPAAMFTHIMSKVQKSLGCSMWYNHHTIKQQHSSDGKTIEKDDPFYGSQWLKAHVTGSYHMKKSDEGVLLTCKKDNYSILTKSIDLAYNPETHVSLLSDLTKLQPIDRLKAFLRSKQALKLPFTFAQIEAETQLCTRTVRRLLCTTEIEGMLSVENVDRNKKIYRMKE